MYGGQKSICTIWWPFGVFTLSMDASCWHTLARLYCCVVSSVICTAWLWAVIPVAHMKACELHHIWSGWPVPEPNIWYLASWSVRPFCSKWTAMNCGDSSCRAFRRIAHFRSCHRVSAIQRICMHFCFSTEKSWTREAQPKKNRPTFGPRTGRPDQR